MTSLLIDRPKDNRILAALLAEEYQRVLPMLEFVKIELGQVLYGSGDRQRYVYFPTDLIISLVFTTENGSSAELAIIGNDGLVGIPVILGGISTTHQATVQSAGNAYRLNAEQFSHEFDLGGGLQSLALRYAQALMAQMAQSVVCNRHHTVDKQLCRWLLLSLDRLPTNQVRMTHDLIANMLGVRREGVTEAAGKLQIAGLIRYSRGLITVIDRPGLEERVCECYCVIKKELNRLFSMPIKINHAAPHLPQPKTLRQLAEARLHENQCALPALTTDKTDLLHELQVHQIELEMQLETLNRACHEADTLRDRYADIYDFAPVSYFTLNADANILELNLAGAILLGIKRSEKSQHRFNAFVSPETLPEFNRFLAEVLKAQHKRVCEIGLTFNPQRAEVTVRVEAVPDEDGTECRMVIIDISAEKQARQIQADREQHLRTLNQQTLHDEVTRLPNRLLLNDRLWQVMESNKRNGSHGALIYLSLDNCNVPSGKGLPDGANLLMNQIALRLQSSVRSVDTVARINEHEFVVVIDKLLNNLAESTFEAGFIASKICKGFAQPFELTMADQNGKNFEHYCNISIGVSLFASKETMPESILKSAGMAMQRAREAGSNLVRFHDPEASNASDFINAVEKINKPMAYAPSRQ